MADYKLAWRDYRKRRNLAIAGLIWFVLTPVLIPRMPGFASLSTGWAYIVVMVSSAIAILPFLWLLLFRCPRCGAVFTHKGPWSNSVVARKCGNCGLEKYADE